MPDNQYKEVLIVLIACIALFLILAAIILLFLFLYMRRRFIQQKQMIEMQQQFKEQTLKAQLEIQEHTFHAISQEIHDNVGQVLSLAKVQVNIINERQQLDLEMLMAVRENIGKAMTDLRDLSRSLNSDGIRSTSIHDILQQEVQRINRIGILRAGISVEGQAREIDPQKKLILFRILQESLQNCIKHAEATSITIILYYLPDQIMVSIKDDGKGFDLPAVLERNKGQGLKNMQTRIHLAGGTHNIFSLLQQGTHITLTIPYE